MLSKALLLSAIAGATAFTIPSGNVGRLTPAVKASRAISTGPQMSGGSDFVPDMGRRNMMNALLTGSVAGPILVLPAVLISYLTPAKAGGGGGGTIAKDALGNDVKLKDWLAKNPAGSRKLVQGLKGDATYLITKDDNTLEDFGVTAVCTHLGCVVPWNKSANKFACPCR